MNEPPFLLTVLLSVIFHKQATFQKVLLRVPKSQYLIVFRPLLPDVPDGFDTS